eukprot:3623268-Pleurochrysis_carterae.AAC.1
MARAHAIAHVHSIARTHAVVLRALHASAVYTRYGQTCALGVSTSHVGIYFEERGRDERVKALEDLTSIAQFMSQSHDQPARCSIYLSSQPPPHLLLAMPGRLSLLFPPLND